MSGGNLQQLCTGCQNSKVCEKNRNQNFATSRNFDQCRPEMIQQVTSRNLGSRNKSSSLLRYQGSARAVPIEILKIWVPMGLVKDFRQKLKFLSFTFLTFVQTEIIPTNDAITMATFYKDTYDYLLK